VRRRSSQQINAETSFFRLKLLQHDEIAGSGLSTMTRERLASPARIGPEGEPAPLQA
jgi:hypothetical protein